MTRHGRTGRLTGYAGRSIRALDRREGHAAARRLLAARMDGLLSAAETRFLAEHLTGCARCRSVARAYQESHDALQTLRPTVPPRDLGARIGAALDREMAGAQRSLHLPQGLPRPSAALVGPVVAGASAVIVLVVGARLLLAPSAAPATGPGSTIAAMVPATPPATPFAVPAAELALVEQGSDGLTVYRADVSEMCPPAAVDCATTEHASQRIGLASGLVPRGVSMDRQSRRMALLAEDSLGADTVSVVVLPPMEDDHEPRGVGPGPDGRLPAPVTVGSSGPAIASLSPDASIKPADAPARVLAILDGVEAVGAPPAWSPDGTMLAFSAMPVDRSRGPDIYLWRPGQDRARRLTTDHGSWFASWSGERVVVSRLERGQGREVADTVLIDPDDGAEEVAHLANAWLPSVDPSGRFAVAWKGTLTGGIAQVRPRSGGLSLIDWQVVDPGASSEATPLAMLGPAGPKRSARGGAHAPAKAPSAWLESIEPGTRDTPAALDWEVQWATSGTTFGYWFADARGASWGRLTVLRVVPDTRRIDRKAVLLGPTLARRAFSLGEERIAWVAPADEGADGELHVRTWGVPGEGTMRIRDIHLRDGIPAF